MMRFPVCIFFLLIVQACGVKDQLKDPVIKPITFTTNYPAAEPNLFTDSLGQVYLSWIEKNGPTAILRYAKLGNEKWSEPITIASGDNWFVNWADFPQFVTNGENGFLASTLVKSGKSTYAYDIHLYHSADGVKWNGPVLLHDDGKQAEHGFVSMMPEKNRVLITWLDGRNTITDHDNHSSDEHGGAMTLRAAYVDYTGKKISEWELDQRVCDCCQTSVAKTKDGPIAIYRDRSEEEIRDIYMVRISDQTAPIPKPVFEDNWQVNGCPVNGPKMEASGNTLAMAWYSEPNKKPQVKMFFSMDAGNTFGKPVRIDEGNPKGRVDITLMEDSVAYVSWLEKDIIKLTRVNGHGVKGKSIQIAQTSPKRSSGFPQLTKDGTSLVMAWTDDRDSLQIKTVRVMF